MRRVLALTILLATLLAVGACQPWGINNPPRIRSNPELQALRESRQNGVRTRCAECHAPAPDLAPGR